MNQDGRTNGLMAPSRRSQEQVLADAYRRAGVSPGTVQYVETQGLGTLLGDAIEAEALGAVLADGRATDDPCVIGSVKTNIGHLEAASGVAGVIKVAMSLRHRTIPATLNFTKPNPNIPFDTLPLRVAERQMPWPDRGRAVAGVSAFGFGGTNAHVVLAEAPQVRVTEAPDDTVGDRVKILPLSARSPEALAELASRYEAALADGAPLADLCYTAAVRRAHHDHRFAAVGTTRDEMRTALATFRQGPPERSGRRRRGQRPGAVFVVTGEGSHWSGMGQQLYAEEPAFRDALAACDRALRPHLEHSVLTELLAAPAESHLDDVDVVAAGVFAVQVAMAALWRSWGIQPAAVIGHGMGEVAAAHIAGVLSLEDAARLLCARARFSRRRSDRAGRAELKAVLDRLQPTETTTPLYSTVTGTAVDGQLLDDGHWAVNVASPCAYLGRDAPVGRPGARHLPGDQPASLDGRRGGFGIHTGVVPSLRRIRARIHAGVTRPPVQQRSVDRLGAATPVGRSARGRADVSRQRERFWLDDLDDTDATPSQPRTDVDVPAIDDTLGEEALKVRLDRADQPERQRLLRSYLQSQTAGRLGMPPSLLDIQSPLTTFGVDSLMAAELRKQIEHDLGIVCACRSNSSTAQASPPWPTGSVRRCHQEPRGNRRRPFPPTSGNGSQWRSRGERARGGALDRPTDTGTARVRRRRRRAATRSSAG